MNIYPKDNEHTQGVKLFGFKQDGRKQEKNRYFLPVNRYHIEELVRENELRVTNTSGKPCKRIELSISTVVLPGF